MIVRGLIRDGNMDLLPGLAKERGIVLELRRPWLGAGNPDALAFSLVLDSVCGVTLIDPKTGNLRILIEAEVSCDPAIVSPEQFNAESSRPADEEEQSSRGSTMLDFSLRERD